MSGDWTRYFEYRKIWPCDAKYYTYKDKSVVKLPDDLPMPPTDTFYMMFYDCQQLQDIAALANWDVSNVKDMHEMFGQCDNLRDITPLANWDVSKVETMERMFSSCDQLEDISALANWNVSNIENMERMFYACYQLQNICALENSLKAKNK